MSSKNFPQVSALRKFPDHSAERLVYFLKKMDLKIWRDKGNWNLQDKILKKVVAQRENPKCAEGPP